MRIARIDLDGAARAAIVADGAARPLPEDVGVLDLLAAAPADRDRLAARATTELALDEVRLLAPVQPASMRDFSVFEQHVLGAVKNAAGPDAQVQDAWYEGPQCYFSNPHTVNGPGAAVAAPPGSTQLDLELEVAVVIGRGGRDVGVADASDHIAGYTIWNDWSARDIAGRELRLPFGFLKAKDFANTLGPWIVTPDELEPFRDGDRLDLVMKASINGTELGGDTLASMAWSFEELVAFAAMGSAIAPGDVLGSGTCGGGCLYELWGHAQALEPPPLQPGDVVTLEVEGIGTLTNTVVAQTVEPLRFPRARTHQAGVTS
jgi:2-keto-4-pentenoate hydratase/2-oxohepta-3-ene-1,7-dioic acid hydratase in catechol pathway